MAAAGALFIYYGGVLDDNAHYTGRHSKNWLDIDFATFDSTQLYTKIRELGYHDFVLYYRRPNDSVSIPLKMVNMETKWDELFECARNSQFLEFFVEDLANVEVESPLSLQEEGMGDEFIDCMLSGGIVRNEGNDFHSNVEVEALSYDSNSEECANEGNDIMVEDDEELQEAFRESSVDAKGKGKDDINECDREPEQTELNMESESVEYRTRIFDPDCKPNDIKFEIGLIFTNKEEFKNAICAYAVASATNVHVTRSDSQRVQAKCSDGCPWYIWGAAVGNERTWMVKAYCGEHVCGRTFSHRGMVTYKWLATNYHNKMNSRAREIKQYAMEDHKVGVSLGQCKRAKKLAMERVFGSFKEQFAKLKDYVHELLKANVGSNIKMQLCKTSVDSMPEFERLYICLAALREGFTKYCRPVIGLDGCFLKGYTKGILLAAVARDGNDQVYPLAWAVVEGESKSSWSWFMDLLKDDLGSVDGFNICFITDQQKGLVDAVATLMPQAEHRCCARHVFDTWSPKHRGREMEVAFWKCAFASNEPHLRRAIEEMAELDADAAADIIKSDPTKWSRAYFKDFSKCDAVENNSTESFNGMITDARCKPIISLLEDIRTSIFCRIGKLKLEAARFKEGFGPRVRDTLNENIMASAKFYVITNRNGDFECYMPNNRSEGYAVNLDKRTCACRLWQVSGLPCPHACAAINYMNLKPEEYVHECFSTEKVKALYAIGLPPVNGSSLWQNIAME